MVAVTDLEMPVSFAPDNRAETGHDPGRDVEVRLRCGSSRDLQRDRVFGVGGGHQDRGCELAARRPVYRGASATETAADRYRGKPGFFWKSNFPAKDDERVGERPDRPLLHPGAAGESDRVVREERGGGEQAQGGAGVIKVKHRARGAGEYPVASLHGHAPVTGPDGGAELFKGGDRELCVVGHERVDDRARALCECCRDEGTVRVALGWRGSDRKVDTAPPGEGDDHGGTPISG